MRLLSIYLFALALAACGAPPPDAADPSNAPEVSDASDTGITDQTPPPLPENASSVAFERPADTTDTTDAPTETTTSTAPVYWGVKEGEPLTLMWEDLMPEGSEEELMREYEEFYAMLEQRYAANTTTLADAADPYAKFEEGSEFDFMPQLGSFDTVEDLDGMLVRMPGYVVPFDFSTDQRKSEFLFVPYMGACIHTPPPPPNQIVFIRADPPTKIDDIWVPYWIEGTLSTEKTENDLGNTAYAMQMSKIEPYPMLD